MSTETTTGVAEQLRAGPIRMNFVDGELRYLHVGNKEIIRRIYFAVRDGQWDTPISRFERLDIDKGTDQFTVTMQAVVQHADVHLAWSGMITGTAEGDITFAVECEALLDFESPRVGICILFGGESMPGQAFELTHADGSKSQDMFPQRVKPTLVVDYHQSLAYRTNDGIDVTSTMSGAPLRMEDQRNFGDSSFKAFTDNQFGDNRVPKGSRGGHEYTLRVRVDNDALLQLAMQDPPDAPIRIAIDPHDQSDKHGTVPAIAIGTSKPLVGYSELNRNRDDYRSLDEVTFGFTPGCHLFDDDTYMENITVIVSEVATLRSFASCSRVQIDPVTLARPDGRPRHGVARDERFAGPWCARMVKYLSLAGVDGAAFDIDGPSATTILNALREHAGQSLIATSVEPHEHVDAFAIEHDGQRSLWLINKTSLSRRVELAPGAQTCTLSPYEVRTVTGI